MAQFTNQAQLSFRDTVIQSNIAVGEITEVLSAAKTAVRTNYAQEDETVTYVISITNTGSAPYTGVTITDDLGGYTFDQETVYPLSYVEDSMLYYLNGVLQTTAPAVTAGPPMEISGVTVPACGSAMLVYEARLTPYASREEAASITNTAVISGDGAAPLEVSETITAATEPRLSITKTISPVPVAGNGTVTYTFLIQNTGNAPVTEADDAVITDTFEPQLNNLVVDFNGAAWTADQDYTYVKNVFTSTAGAVTVPAAEFCQDPVTGMWIATPGVSTLTISGTIVGGSTEATQEKKPAQP